MPHFSMEHLREHAKYLGDGVYTTFDGYQLWLHTSDGESVTNSIAMEPDVFDAFLKIAKGKGYKVKP